MPRRRRRRGRGKQETASETGPNEPQTWSSGDGGNNNIAHDDMPPQTDDGSWPAPPRSRSSGTGWGCAGESVPQDEGSCPSPSSTRPLNPPVAEPPAPPSAEQLEMTRKSTDSRKRGNDFFKSACLPGLSPVRDTGNATCCKSAIF